MNDAEYLDFEISRSPDLDTKLNQLHIRVLGEQAALCVKCMAEPRETMLCNGLQLSLDRLHWAERRKVRTFYAPCTKRQSTLDAEKTKFKFEQSGLPARFVETCKFHNTLKIWIDDTGIQFHDTMFPPKFRMVYSLENSKQLMGYLYHAVKFGYSVRYVIPYLLMTKSHHQVKEVLRAIMEDEIDLVVVDRLDFLGAERFDRKQLFQALAVRIQAGLPTIVTLSATLQQTERDELEAALLNEVQSFQEVRFA